VHRGHPIAVVIEDAAGKESGRRLQPKLPLDCIPIEFGLYGFKKLSIQDRLVLSSVDPAAINHLADIETILEQVR
jgi:hypothetical protein